MKQNKKLNLMQDVYDELEKINKMALEIRKDFILGEATTAEYGCYVRLCLKKLNILKKIVENLDIPNENIIKQEFYALLEKLEPALIQMVNHAGTGTDTNAQITCNALFKSFKSRYGAYLTDAEFEDAVTL